MRHTQRTKFSVSRLRRSLIVLGALVLFLDTLLVARFTGLLRLPGEMSEVEVARVSALALGDRYRMLARNAGVLTRPPVESAIASYEESVRAAEGPDGVAQAIRRSGELQSVVMQEEARAQRETVLSILNDDDGVRRWETPVVTMVVAPGESGMGIVVRQETPILEAATQDKLATNRRLYSFSQALTIEVGNGRASILTPEDQRERVELLSLELETLRRAVQEVRAVTGYTSLSGPGVVIKASDAPGGYLWAEIVHERDIREIVNNLMAAGAEGVEIGNQRIVATSWIRCVGPLVIVNTRTVAANPVVIRAVGPDPEALARSVSGLARTFRVTGKKLDVKVERRLTVAGYNG